MRKALIVSYVVLVAVVLFMPPAGKSEPQERIVIRGLNAGDHHFVFRNDEFDVQRFRFRDRWRGNRVRELRRLDRLENLGHLRELRHLNRLEDLSHLRELRHLGRLDRLERLEWNRLDRFDRLNTDRLRRLDRLNFDRLDRLDRLNRLHRLDRLGRLSRFDREWRRDRWFDDDEF